jgi:hypothetical protein
MIQETPQRFADRWNEFRLALSCSDCILQRNFGFRAYSRLIVKTFKFKIGVLWTTIAEKQQISGDFI